MEQSITRGHFHYTIPTSQASPVHNKGHANRASHADHADHADCIPYNLSTHIFIFFD